MYISGFVLAVPERNKEAFRKVSEGWWEIAKDYGALEHAENWESDVPDGERTDFRRAVDLQEGEKVVFSWVIWPDKETADASHERMTADPRMAKLGDEPLLDPKRMIYGNFESLVRKKRD
ncbi:DUF1428 domain-containing protein [Pelagerythrobacter rhizovicinus]|uniref:DUF1428 domain-containing protein n=1 Tax=Pelagerythrobacter rhizovicinus TaxID=2268576 RepID=A0A4Q2KQT0_9SPHN|nr:DUF1428 domain-containing protein [Pelagerythrobacter rhizovicinus]RXZ65992.1 DUF1428 domain-containing protein [Pelagerythrobacter rhizovicinus]